MSQLPNIAVLVSGNGSNLQALIDAVQAKTLDENIHLVLSNRPGVRALERAAQAGIPAQCINHHDFESREAFDQALIKTMKGAGIELVVLAGFDRLLTPAFIQAFPDQIINVHPALLPAFPGLHSAQQALDYGAKITGVTVHFVDEGMDTGSIILQEPVEITDEDTEDSLLTKIHAVEHRLLPKAVGLAASKTLKRIGRRIYITK